jgi:large subunit ribosomal protein L21
MAEKKATTKVAKKSDEFAIIEAGGKQHVVSVGDILDVELMGATYEKGDEVFFDKVLLVDNGKDATIGTPYISGAKVTATYEGLRKAPKITIVRYKAKSNRDRKIGHRQHYDRVKIKSLG